MSDQTWYAVLQIERDRKHLPRERLGVFDPVNCDGLYREKEDAIGVARFFAEQRPDLRTMIVAVVMDNVC